MDSLMSKGEAHELLDELNKAKSFTAFAEQGRRIVRLQLHVRSSPPDSKLVGKLCGCVKWICSSLKLNEGRLEFPPATESWNHGNMLGTVTCLINTAVMGATCLTAASTTAAKVHLTKDMVKGADRSGLLAVLAAAFNSLQMLLVQQPQQHQAAPRGSLGAALPRNLQQQQQPTNPPASSTSSSTSPPKRDMAIRLSSVLLEMWWVLASAWGEHVLNNSPLTASAGPAVKLASTMLKLWPNSKSAAAALTAAAKAYKEGDEGAEGGRIAAWTTLAATAALQVADILACCVFEDFRVVQEVPSPSQANSPQVMTSQEMLHLLLCNFAVTASVIHTKQHGQRGKFVAAATDAAATARLNNSNSSSSSSKFFGSQQQQQGDAAAVVQPYHEQLLQALGCPGIVVSDALHELYTPLKAVVNHSAAVKVIELKGEQRRHGFTMLSSAAARLADPAVDPTLLQLLLLAQLEVMLLLLDDVRVVGCYMSTMRMVVCLHMEHRADAAAAHPRAPPVPTLGASVLQPVQLQLAPALLELLQQPDEAFIAPGGDTGSAAESRAVIGSNFAALLVMLWGEVDPAQASSIIKQHPVSCCTSVEAALRVPATTAPEHLVAVFNDHSSKLLFFIERINSAFKFTTKYSVQPLVMAAQAAGSSRQQLVEALLALLTTCVKYTGSCANSLKLSWHNIFVAAGSLRVAQNMAGSLGSSCSSGGSSDAMDEGRAYVALAGRCLGLIGRALACVFAANAQQWRTAELTVLPNNPHLALLEFLDLVTWIGPELSKWGLPGQGTAADDAGPAREALQQLQQLQQQQQQLQQALSAAVAKAQQISHSHMLGCPRGSSRGSCWCSTPVGTQDFQSSNAAFSLAQDILQVLGDDELALQLQQFGAALSTELPQPRWCNNPTCTSLMMVSEGQLVGGKACICGGCKVARYCGAECQKQHWRTGHKVVCKRLQSSSCSKGQGKAKTATASHGASAGGLPSGGEQQHASSSAAVEAAAATAAAGGVNLPVCASEAAALSVKELKGLCKQLNVPGTATAIEKGDLVQLLVNHLRLT